MAGHKETHFLRRINHEGKEVIIPVAVITGAYPGSQITILGGQHGTEYDGITGCQQAFQRIDPDRVHGKIIFGLILNMESFTNWIQFAPTSPVITDMMRELAVGSEAIINCHGGEVTEGMEPYVICRLLGDAELDKKAMAMADAFGTKYVSFSKYRGDPPPMPNGERPAWWLWPKRGMADELRIPEITPEIGQRGSRGEDGMMVNGILNVLKTLGFLEGQPFVTELPRPIGDRYWLTAEKEGIWYPDVKIGDDVVKGQKLGEVKDYFGNKIQDVLAPAAAKVMNMNWGMPVKKAGFLLWLGVIDERSKCPVS